MESMNDPNGAKRKRSPSDVLPLSRPAPSAPSAASPNPAGQVNYLSRAKKENLKLIEGDADTLGEVLQLLDEYDGVLQRHESFAGNLGATLVGPLLMDGFEKFFSGPIKLIGATKGAPPAEISWVDIVNFSQENPDSFHLEDEVADAEIAEQTGPQAKVCRFWINGSRIQITENDWRLILSGVPKHMLPQQLAPEDEHAEIVTLDILESRFSALIKKADAVATRTRQLNYQMRNRKQAIMARRGHMPAPASEHNSGESSQQAINSPYAAMAPNAQDLLRQFSLSQQDPSTPTAGSKAGSSKRLKTSASSGNMSALANPSFTSINSANSPRTTSSPNPRSRKNDKTLLEDPPYRAIMVAHIEKLERGAKIWPPCDRCRRLKMDCTKNYTACLGCTKKHCKCFFREVDQGEIMIAGLEGTESEGDAHNEGVDKKQDIARGPNEHAAMANAAERAAENANAYGQENRDVEMGGIGAGISSPSSANNGSRAYSYDPAAALLASLERTQSPNGAPAATGYAGQQKAMTANMTGPVPGAAHPGERNDQTGLYEHHYPPPPPGLENAQNPSVKAEDYPSHQHPQIREGQSTQGQDVNYIRPIGNAGDAVMREVYAMPSDGLQAGAGGYRNADLAAQHRDMERNYQEDFDAEMRREAEAVASGGSASGIHETVNGPSS